MIELKINSSSPLLLESWPPIYQVRISQKAKHIHLKISHQKGLEIVVPYRQQKRLDAQAVLNHHRVWVEKKMAQFKNHPQFLKEKAPLPQEIHFPSLQETWRIHYYPTEKNRLILKEKSPYLLHCTGKIQEEDHVKKRLRHWLQKKAALFLFPWMEQLKNETGLIYETLSVRGQTTLWGSCNTRKRISLNYKLLFLPIPLIRHVLLHELCHIRYLNHSLRFWNLLKQFDPDFQHHKRALSKADQLVPAWLE